METSERQFMYAGSGKGGNNASEKKCYHLMGSDDAEELQIFRRHRCTCSVRGVAGIDTVDAILLRWSIVRRLINLCDVVKQLAGNGRPARRR